MYVYIYLPLTCSGPGLIPAPAVSVSEPSTCGEAPLSKAGSHARRPGGRCQSPARNAPNNTCLPRQRGKKGSGCTDLVVFQ